MYVCIIVLFISLPFLIMNVIMHLIDKKKRLKNNNCAIPQLTVHYNFAIMYLYFIYFLFYIQISKNQTNPVSQLH